ncbi:MAG: efflux RND transporter periplasmic adaptor subunit, partial [Campylobacterales bacterium]|nr:efflux RND transporter periplasmic adaptor subunit [Campylobacterales bacterium]
MKKIFTLIFLTELIFAYTVKKESIVQNKEYVGTIYSFEERMIATRLMGYIKSIKVEEGDFVKKDDVLFVVDPSDIDSQINQAKASLMQTNSAVLSAELSVSDAKKDYERYKNLYEKGAVSKRDFEKMELNLELRKSQLENAMSMKKQATAALEQANSQSKYSTITAPIDGVVISKMKKTA